MISSIKKLTEETKRKRFLTELFENQQPEQEEAHEPEREDIPDSDPTEYIVKLAYEIIVQTDEAYDQLERSVNLIGYKLAELLGDTVEPEASSCTEQDDAAEQEEDPARRFPLTEYGLDPDETDTLLEALELQLAEFDSAYSAIEKLGTETVQITVDLNIEKHISELEKLPLTENGYDRTKVENYLRQLYNAVKAKWTP